MSIMESKVYNLMAGMETVESLEWSGKWQGGKWQGGKVNTIYESVC